MGRARLPARSIQRPLKCLRPPPGQAGGLHRDVTGGNLLVRPEDGHATLVDFGSCTFRGAPDSPSNPGH